MEHCPSPASAGVDDFLHRMEIALFAYGFNGDNSIGEHRMERREHHNAGAGAAAGACNCPRVWLLWVCLPPGMAGLPQHMLCSPLLMSAAMVNMCRDEVTNTLKHK